MFYLVATSWGTMTLYSVSNNVFLVNNKKLTKVEKYNINTRNERFNTQLSNSVLYEI